VRYIGTAQSRFGEAGGGTQILVANSLRYSPTTSRGAHPAYEFFNCPWCQSPVWREASSCQKCGSELQKISQELRSPVQRPPASLYDNRVILVVGTLVLVWFAIFAIVGGYAYGFYVVRNVDTDGLFCLTTSQNYDPYTGSSTLVETIGVRNTSPYEVHATWTMVFDFGNGIRLADTHTFAIPGHSQTYTNFSFNITRNNALRIPQNSNPTFTWTRDYSVLRFTYHMKSSIQGGTGSANSSQPSSSPPSCTA